MEEEASTRANVACRTLRPTVSNVSLNTFSSLETGPRHIRLPQSRWSDVPVSFRSPEWIEEAGPAPDEDASQSPFNSGRLRQETDDTAATTPKRRRFRQGLRAIIGHVRYGLEEQPFDPSLLHPQTGSADDITCSYSTRNEIQYVARSVSQPNTPKYRQSDFCPQDALQMQVPGSPTYPRPSCRWTQMASGFHDVGFADPRDFRLFAEATAGLGVGHEGSPLPGTSQTSFSAPRPSSSQVSPLPSNLSRRPQCQPWHRASDVTSPLEQTPITRRALQEMAQMPQWSSTFHQPSLDAAMYGVDVWLPDEGSQAAFNRRRMVTEHPINQLLEGEMDEDIQDELPDYAASQVQAQAAQRIQAAKRAEELHRRWRESGARHGF